MSEKKKKELYDKSHKLKSEIIKIISGKNPYVICTALENILAQIVLDTSITKEDVINSFSETVDFYEANYKEEGESE